MDQKRFSRARAKLGKTQKELAALLGISLKAVQSYDQGWRTVPLHVERYIFFLLASRKKDLGEPEERVECWTRKGCDCKESCPAWEFQAGHLCWFLSGTLCECASNKNWRDKMDICRSCEVLTSLI